jgi:polar amino acid transport system permease protein
MLKTTSLLAFIGVRELFQDADIRYSSSFQATEYFSGVAVLYLLLTTIWGVIQSAIERKLGASDRDVHRSIRQQVLAMTERSRARAGRV